MAAIVHIVDDDKSFRTAIGRLLETSGFNVLGYASAAEILASLRVDEPGCILVDLQMPGLNGLELQKLLNEKAPLLPVIFLTGVGNVASTVLAMKAGADDFLEKPVSSEDLLAAVNRALQRYGARRVEHDRLDALRAKVASLTTRETQVFDLMVRGKRNKQIAYAIGVSERTVKAHRKSIMEKLNAQSFAEAVSIAERLGLLKSPDQPPA